MCGLENKMRASAPGALPPTPNPSPDLPPAGARGEGSICWTAALRPREEVAAWGGPFGLKKFSRAVRSPS